MKNPYGEAVPVTIDGRTRALSALDFFRVLEREQIRIGIDNNGRFIMRCSGSAEAVRIMEALRRCLEVAPELEALILMNLVYRRAASPLEKKAASALKDLIEERACIKEADSIEITPLQCAVELVRHTPAGKDGVLSHAD